MKKKMHDMSRAAMVVVALLVGLAIVATVVPVSHAAYAASSDGLYYSDYDTYEEEQEAANDFNVELAEESYTLLKNENDALPLSLKTEKWVSVFGVRSDNIILGGSGSGGGSVADSVNVQSSLESAGFKVNPSLVSIYAQDSNTLEQPTSMLKTAESSYGIYNDAAIIIISRTGSEFYEASLWNVDGHSDLTDHYYMLDDNEKDLIKYVEARFDKVILVINSAHVIELGDVQNDEQMDAILWMGHPGTTGAMALGEILSGEINPSGHTVDVYPAHFANDPTWENFKGSVQSRLVSGYELQQDANGTWSYVTDENGDYVQALYVDNFFTPEQLNTPGFSQVNVPAPSDSSSGMSGSFTNADYLCYDRVTDIDGNQIALDGPSSGAQYNNVVDYEEGIYVGYRWYETAYEEIKNGNYVPEGYETYTNLSERADAWYSDNVVYPFGYGLSYSDFTWEITSIDGFTQSNLSGDQADVTVNLKVTNNGTTAGKDVGEIYVSAPYYQGGTEKSSVTLVSFVKSKLLKAGASQTVSVTFKAQDMASYDYLDDGGTISGTKSTGNGHTGYELDKGDYTIGVYDDAHTAQALESFTVSTTINYDTDSTTGAAVTNLFTGDGEWDGTRADTDYYESRLTSYMNGVGTTYMSRADFAGTYPLHPTEDDLSFTDDALTIIRSQVYYTSFNDLPSDPWYRSEEDTEKGGEMEGWTQASASEVNARTNGKTEIQLKDMMGVPYDSDKWVTFLNQLSWDELVTLASYNNFGTRAMDAIGKYAETDSDGPAQLSSGTWWVCEVNIASTWNTDLVYTQGLFVGNESLLLGVEGWYGPGLDFHRNPAAGRNFEYYAQDGVLSGKIAAAVIRGATDKGTIVYMKHLFGNDQETSRYTSSTFMTEQALREIYIKPFEIAIKEGNANASMSGFNRIGNINNDANYNLYIKLLQGEFGQDAHHCTDMYGWSYNPSGAGDMMARASGTPLGSYPSSTGRNLEGDWDESKNCVVCTFNSDITSGTRWTYNSSTGTWSSTAMSSSNPANINEVNGGASAAYVGMTSIKPGANTGKTLYANGDTIDSYTQWYAVRNTVHKMLYTTANSNAIKNGVDTSVITSISGTYSVVQGVSASGISAAVDTQALGGTNVVYSATNLPDGLSINASTGAISGTTLGNPGTYNVTVTVTVDGWVSASGNITIVVASVSSPSDSIGTMTQGEAFETTFSTGSNITFVTGTSTGYYGVEYSAEGLPAGMTLSSDGVLSGTPTTAGTYTVTVTTTLHYQQAASMGGPGGSMGGGPGGGSSSVTYRDDVCVATYTIVVEANPDYSGGGSTSTGDWTENVPYIGENGNWFVNGVDQGVAAQGPQGEKGDTGATGATGAAGADGKDGTDGADGSGCSSAVATDVAFTAVLVAVAAAAVLVVRYARKKRSDK